jgi:hypothetical protein
VGVEEGGDLIVVAVTERGVVLVGGDIFRGVALAVEAIGSRVYRFCIRFVAISLGLQPYPFLIR